MSSMEVDGATDAGVEECKGESLVAAGAAGAAATAVVAAATGERTQKGKGEGDRNVMLHPVCWVSLPFPYCCRTAGVICVCCHGS